MKLNTPLKEDKDIIVSIKKSEDSLKTLDDLILEHECTDPQECHHEELCEKLWKEAGRWIEFLEGLKEAYASRHYALDFSELKTSGFSDKDIEYFEKDTLDKHDPFIARIDAQIEFIEKFFGVDIIKKSK